MLGDDGCTVYKQNALIFNHARDDDEGRVWQNLKYFKREC